MALEYLLDHTCIDTDILKQGVPDVSLITYSAEFVLPDSDLEHAAEQLRVVGDNPSDVNDQLLLQHGLPLSTSRGAPAVDDALDHPGRQRVGDHLFLLPE